MAENRAFSGARCKLFVTGDAGRQELGWGSGVSGNVQVQTARVDTLGNIFSQSIENVGVTVSVTVDAVTIVDTTLVDYGIDFTQGDTVNLINSPAMEIEVYDYVGDQPIERISGARMSQRSWNVQARSLMAQNVAFEAIKSKSGA